MQARFSALQFLLRRQLIQVILYSFILQILQVALRRTFLGTIRNRMFCVPSVVKRGTIKIIVFRKNGYPKDYKFKDNRGKGQQAHEAFETDSGYATPNATNLGHATQPIFSYGAYTPTAVNFGCPTPSENGLTPTFTREKYEQLVQFLNNNKTPKPEIHVNMACMFSLF